MEYEKRDCVRETIDTTEGTREKKKSNEKIYTYHHAM